MILYEDYCPSSEIWQRFLVGELTESGVEQLYGHLDQCALCIGLLGALASRSFVQSRGPGGEGLAAPPLLPPESPLRRVGPDGRFELVYTVGTGGMGTVFAAVDHAHRGGADSAALLVAVKLMRPAGDARQRAESILRFKREFRAVQSLSQPNLVTLHELIQDGDELLLVMELVPGVDLLTYLERGTPAPAQYTARLRALLPQLVAALHHLHAAGIVHRDLKPSSVAPE